MLPYGSLQLHPQRTQPFGQWVRVLHCEGHPSEGMAPTSTTYDALAGHSLSFFVPRSQSQPSLRFQSVLLHTGNSVLLPCALPSLESYDKGTRDRNQTSATTCAPQETGCNCECSPRSYCPTASWNLTLLKEPRKELSC